MLNRSVFIFSCVCGRQFQKEDRGSFHCPDCGRLLVLEWRADGSDGEGADMEFANEESACAHAESL